MALKGHVVTEETRIKISEKLKGRKLPESVRAKLRGREISENHKSKIGDGVRRYWDNSGRRVFPRYCVECGKELPKYKKSLRCRNCYVTDEFRAKIAEVSPFQKGYIPWNIGLKAKDDPRIKKSTDAMHETRKGMAAWNKDIPQTEEVKRKLSEVQRGAKSSNWKGGLVELAKQIRRSFEYRQWHSDVFMRDDFTCQKCGRRGGKLHAHHKKSFALIIELNDVRTAEEATKCSELWDINNGITLCKRCHETINKTGGKNG